MQNPNKNGTSNGMTKAGELNGDLRKLPKTPQKPVGEAAPVREPGDKPKVLPTPKKP